MAASDVSGRSTRPVRRDLSPSEVDSLLGTLRLSGHFATARSAGAPQVAPVWFLWERPVLWLVTFRDSARAANIIRNPAVALSVDAGTFPAVGIVLYGSARLEDVGDGEVVRRIVRRYRPADDVEGFVQRYRNDPNRVLVRTDTERIVSWDSNPRHQGGERP
jgi:PPOX class probable F420-dependent enzyme